MGSNPYPCGNCSLISAIFCCAPCTAEFACTPRYVPSKLRCRRSLFRALHARAQPPSHRDGLTDTNRRRGYGDAGSVRGDEALGSLRGLGDFERLMQHLAMPADPFARSISAAGTIVL